jgi:murein DD-endopeptidase MepM/ murein hydrolase activator NlpD
VNAYGARRLLAALLAALLVSGCAEGLRGGGPAANAAAVQRPPAAETAGRDHPAGLDWLEPARRAGPGTVVLIPENPRPGEPVSLGVLAGPGGEGPGAAELLNAQGRRLSRAVFFPLPADPAEGPALLTAILTVPSTARPGPARIRLTGIPGPLNEISLTIEGRDFVSEEIELNQALTNIRAASDPQKTAESEQLWAILSRTGTEIFCSGPFSPPVASTRRTSFFGDRRVFKYADGSSATSIHAGVDYGVPTGTPVHACGPGRVALARNRIVTGNSVVLEHLPGVYSLYYHLDSIAVAEGLMVDTGTLLGRVGATGLATGPHLHWEIRVAGENTDPDILLARPLIDKDAILAKMNAVAF